MHKNPFLLLCICSGTVLAQAGGSGKQRSFAESYSLTLDESIARVFESHPVLAAGQSALSARTAAADQAGRGPNPELGVEIEDVAGSGAFRGVDEAQTTFQLSQTLEWMGKRAGRRRVADAERNLAEVELLRKRSDLRALTRERFMETLVAERRLAMAEEAADLAQRLLDAVARRVREGATSSADELRSRLAVSEAKLEFRRDSLRLFSSRQKLALLLGMESLDLPPLRGDLDSLPIAPPVPGTQALAQSPQAAFKAANIGLAEARILQQSSLAGPDISLSAGFRHAAGPGDLALVGGISLPLPIRNRNQGGKEEARHEFARARAEERVFLQNLQSDAADIHQALVQARDEANTLRETLIPDAEKAALVLEEGYRRGRFSLLEVLSARGDLFRHRTQYLDAYLRYQQGLAEWERLMGAGEAPERK